MGATLGAGATLGCCNRKCGLSFHFECLRRAGGHFLADKRTFCAAHDPLQDEFICGKLARDARQREAQRVARLNAAARAERLKEARQAQKAELAPKNWPAR